MRFNIASLLVLVLAGCATAQDWNVSVKTDTNGTLRTPTNFIPANGIATVSAMNASNAVQDAAMNASNAADRVYTDLAASNAAVNATNYTDGVATNLRISITATSAADRVYADSLTNGAVFTNNTLFMAIISNAVASGASVVVASNTIYLTVPTNFPYWAVTSAPWALSSEIGATSAADRVFAGSMVTATSTADRAYAKALTNGLYHSSNPSNYVTASVTNGLGSGGMAAIWTNTAAQVITVTTNFVASTNLTDAELVVEAMSGYTTPEPYTNSHSGWLDDATYKPWKVFDRAAGEAFCASDTSNKWIQIDLASSNRPVFFYQIVNGGVAFIEDWDIDGSTNATDWVTLDSQRGYSLSAFASTPIITLGTNNVSNYQFYRFINRASMGIYGFYMNELRLWTTNSSGAVTTNIVSTTNTVYTPALTTSNWLGGGLAPAITTPMAVTVETDGTVRVSRQYLAGTNTAEAVAADLAELVDATNSWTVTPHTGLANQTNGSFASTNYVNAAVSGKVDTVSIRSASTNRTEDFATSNQGARADLSLTNVSINGTLFTVVDGVATGAVTAGTSQDFSTNAAFIAVSNRAAGCVFTNDIGKIGMITMSDTNVFIVSGDIDPLNATGNPDAFGTYYIGGTNGQGWYMTNETGVLHVYEPTGSESYFIGPTIIPADWAGGMTIATGYVHVTYGPATNWTGNPAGTILMIGGTFSNATLQGGTEASGTLTLNGSNVLTGITAAQVAGAGGLTNLNPSSIAAGGGLTNSGATINGVPLTNGAAITISVETLLPSAKLFPTNGFTCSSSDYVVPTSKLATTSLVAGISGWDDGQYLDTGAAGWQLKFDVAGTGRYAIVSSCEVSAMAQYKIGVMRWMIIHSSRTATNVAAFARAVQGQSSTAETIEIQTSFMVNIVNTNDVISPRIFETDTDGGAEVLEPFSTLSATWIDIRKLQ